MNELAFEQILDRLHRYVDVLSAESIDMEQVIYQLIQSTDIVFANVTPVDLPPLEQTQQQTIGHRLVYFKGDLRVPEIERDHLIQTEDVAPSMDPFDVSSFFSLPFGWLGLKLLVNRLKKRRTGLGRNKRDLNNSPGEPGTRSKPQKQRAKKAHPYPKRKNKPGTAIKSKKIKSSAPPPVKPVSETDSVDIESDQSTRKLNEQRQHTEAKKVRERFKSQLSKKFPDRFKLNQSGHLLEIKPNGTYKPVSTANLEKHVDSLLVQDVKFPKALKALRGLAAVAGVVFTVYDLYRIYDITTDDTLSEDEKIQGVAPIVGELVGATTGAIAGAALGTVLTGGPWGTFLGAVVGGLSGAFAGDAVGEMLAEYIVKDMENPPPTPYDGKTWDQLTPAELEDWLIYKDIKSRQTYIDTPGTQEIEFKPPVFDQPGLQFKLDPVPDQPVEGTTVPSSQQSPDEKVSQLINQYIIDKNRIKQQRQQVIQDIEQLV